MSSGSHVVRAQGLRLRYGRRPVLDGLDLSVPQGGIYGLLGRNAAGKTTTLRLLAGMLRPRAGQIELFGEPRRRIRPRDRRSIGFVSQEPRFYPWMRIREVADLVRPLYPTWDDAWWMAIVGRFELDLTQRVGTLSTGTGRKLAVALALAHRPPLLLLDEPTAGVDPITRREILDLLKEATRAGDQTALFSTHDLTELEAAADHIGLLHGGRLQLEGPLAQIRARFLRVPLEGAEEAATIWKDERGAVIDAERCEMAPSTAGPASLEDVFFALTATGQAKAPERSS